MRASCAWVKMCSTTILPLPDQSTKCTCTRPSYSALDTKQRQPDLHNNKKKSPLLPVWFLSTQKKKKNILKISFMLRWIKFRNQIATRAGREKNTIRWRWDRRLVGWGQSGFIQWRAHREQRKGRVDPRTRKTTVISNTKRPLVCVLTNLIKSTRTEKNIIIIDCP